jgi:hypothetical protein
VTGDGSGKTLAYANGISTATTVGSGTQSPAVLLGQDFYMGNTFFESNVLVHELLHAYTGWSDAQMFAFFKNYGLTDTMGTESISAWISTDCNSTPSAGWENK